MRRPRLRTVRTRVKAVAGLALTAAVLLGLLVMYQIQAGSADRAIQSQLRTYATQIEESAPHGVYPQPLPGFAIDPGARAQVVAPDGTVLAATRDLSGRPALYTLTPGSPVPARQPAASGALPGELSVFGEQVTAGGRQVAIITSTATSLRRHVPDARATRAFPLGRLLIQLFTRSRSRRGREAQPPAGRVPPRRAARPRQSQGCRRSGD